MEQRGAGRRRLRWSAIVGVLGLLWALLSPTGPAEAAGEQAQAILSNPAGDVIGAVGFTQVDGEVAVRVEVTGLATGFHGFHVHDVGACTPDFTAAGGHYNPGGTTHGEHAGDMPVLLANGDGVARASFRTDRFSVPELLAADVAVIIHAEPDNYANVPDRYSSAGGSGPDAITLATGDAGARAACGVVGGGQAPLSAGYWIGGDSGGVFTFGDADFFGSSAGAGAVAPFVGIGATPSNQGYRLAGADGGVFTHGNASFEGSAAAFGLTETVVGIATPPAEAAAPLVDAAGTRIGTVTFAQEGPRVRVTAEAVGIEPSGFHGFHVHDVGACSPDFTAAGGHYNPEGRPHGSHSGDMPVLLAHDDGTAQATFSTDRFSVDELLAADVAVIVHAAPDNYANIPNRYSSDGDTGPDAATLATGDAGGRIACGVVDGVGPGYWLAGSEGGVFSFGVGFFGSAATLDLQETIMGIVPTPSGGGYWLVGHRGGVYSFGDAGFFGSAAPFEPAEAIVGMTPTPTGRGYWLVGHRGGVYSFGDAGFFGSAATLDLQEAIVGMESTTTGAGYYLVGDQGGIYTFGDARFRGSASTLSLDEGMSGMSIAAL